MDRNFDQDGYTRMAHTDIEMFHSSLYFLRTIEVSTCDSSF